MHLSTENEGSKVETVGERVYVQPEVEVPYTPTRELTIERLMEEVKTELLDARYFRLTHGRPSAYNRGCRGHLCLYVTRTRKRESRRKATLSKLPDGVVPDTRSRQEQYWDSVICYILDLMDDIREEIRSNHRDDMEKALDSMIAEWQETK
jgi:hypothetical protein